jgi:hypothetical protein
VSGFCRASRGSRHSSCLPVTAAKEIIAEEGVLALFGRGLPTRLITNGLQGLLFSVLWRLFTDM